jgi:proteic killer suppression protein
MIRSFRHEGLQALFEDDDGRRLPADMLDRIRLVLSTLHAASSVKGMDLPSLWLHRLKGELKGFYSVTVRANWRIVFRLVRGDAVDVDFIDYH